MRRCAFGLALVCLACWPLTAAAEDCNRIKRARAAVLGAATVTSGETAAAVTGSFGYRVDRCFGLEVEIGVVPDLGNDPPFVPLSNFGFSSEPIVGGVVLGPAPTIFPPPSFDTRLITFMTNARVEIPTTLRTILPYVVGGGGIVSIKRDVSYLPYLALTDLGRPNGRVPPISVLPRSASATETALGLNVGAGVSVRIVKQLFADADMRYMRIFANEELDVNRFGAGISYRF